MGLPWGLLICRGDDRRKIQRRRNPSKAKILREVLYSVLPSILLRAGFERYRRSETLFSLLAFPLDILAMCTFISLNVLEATLAVPDGIELRSRHTAVSCATCFACHSAISFLFACWGLDAI